MSPAATRTEHRPESPEVRRWLRRRDPAEAPDGRSALRWIGPGLVWMVSAVGTGSVLFTPRVAATYRYTLLWLIPGVCFLMWIMIREAGRYSVVTGESLLDGFARLPGPGRWAVWATFGPQLIAAVVGVAGLASIIGSALASAVGGVHTWWAVGSITLAATSVAAGGYRRVEQLSRVLAAILLGITVVAAIQVFPGIEAFGSGLVPSVPADPDLYVIVPWIGTILAGSMGIVWFSYWTAARGYGGTPATSESAAAPVRGTGPVDEAEIAERLSAWITTMARAALVGVVGGGLVLTAFLVLGSELLAPQELVPQGTDVAEDLSQLLAEVWGRVGYWLMIAAVLVALGGSVLANQDGWGRSFADMTLILLRDRDSRRAPPSRRTLQRGFVLALTGLLPIVVVLLVDDPVRIMSVSGIIAALHTPFIVGLIGLVNRRQLPSDLRPGFIANGLMVFSACFYAVVGALSLLAL